MIARTRTPHPWRPFVFCLIVFLVLSCAGSPPQLLETFLQVTVFHDTELDATYEQLTFFAHVRDEDGIDDVDALFLIHDETQLVWRLTPDKWVLRSRGTENWLGAETLTMADYTAFPRGSYRILVSDRAGRRDESVVTLAARVEIDRATAPTLVLSGDELRVVSDHDRTIVRFFSPAGTLLRTTDEPTIPIGDVGGAGGVRAFLYADLGGYGVAAGPFVF